MMTILHKRARSRSAFTLIELLVVVAVIALLISMLLPALGAARESALTTTCLSNTRSISLAAMVYSTDNEDIIVKPAWIVNADPSDPSPPTDGNTVDYWWELLWEYASMPLAEDYDEMQEIIREKRGVFSCPNFNADDYASVPSTVTNIPSGFRTSPKSYGLNTEFQPDSLLSTDPFGRSIYRYPEPLAKMAEIRNPTMTCYVADSSATSVLSAWSIARLSEKQPAGNLTSVVQQEVIIPRHLSGTAINVSYLDGHAKTEKIADLPLDEYRNEDAIDRTFWFGRAKPLQSN